MFKESIQSVIAAGTKHLEDLQRGCDEKSKEAAATVAKAKSEIAGLVTLAKEVPEKVFDRYSNVLVTELRLPFYNGGSNPSPHSFELTIDGMERVRLNGILGDTALKNGKYRAIVLLERVGD